MTDWMPSRHAAPTRLTTRLTRQRAARWSAGGAVRSFSRTAPVAQTPEEPGSLRAVGSVSPVVFVPAFFMPAVFVPVAFVLAAFVLAFTMTPARAHDYTVGQLELKHPIAAPTPPGVGSAAGYLEIVNSGDRDDRLIGGEAAFAGGIELHRTTIEDDVARMRRIDDGVVVPAGTTVRLAPGETHLMFTGLEAALVDGERRAATLVFEHAGSVSVEFAIEPPATGSASEAPMDHGEMDHGDRDHGNRDHGDMNHSDMGHADRGHADRPSADDDPDAMPHDDRQRDDR